MDLIVLLRTAEAVVSALASATPHRTVDGRKLALVTKTGAGRGRFHVFRPVGCRRQMGAVWPLASGEGLRQDKDGSTLRRVGGNRISESRRRAARLSGQGRHIGEQSIRVNPRNGRSMVMESHLLPVHSFSGESVSNKLLPVNPGFPPHGNPEPAGCQIPPSAHALHRAAGRT